MTDLRSAAGLARSLAIYYGRPWRIATMTRFYRRFMGPGDIVFDIGAHVGNRTLTMARTGARVVALEPQALFHRFLDHTMPASVTVLSLAAGPAKGEDMLAISRRHPTVSSLAPGFSEAMGRMHGFRGVAWDSTQPVKTTTLDALIETYGLPTFVKIDVEGYEASVLAGLSQSVPALAFEYLPSAPAAAHASISRLETLGNYRFNFIRGERVDFVRSDWTDADALSNFLGEMARSGQQGDIYAMLDAAPARSSNH